MSALGALGLATFIIALLVFSFLDAWYYGRAKFPERAALGWWRYLPGGGFYAYYKLGPDPVQYGRPHRRRL